MLSMLALSSSAKPEEALDCLVSNKGAVTVAEVMLLFDFCLSPDNDVDSPELLLVADSSLFRCGDEFNIFLIL